MTTARPAPPPPVAIAAPAPPPPREEATFDVECYRNYFLVKFKLLRTGEYISIAAYGDERPDVAAIERMMRRVVGYGFNCNNYDLPMIRLALTGAPLDALKNASDRIIKERLKPWEFEREYNLGYPPAYFNTVDLMEVAPGVGISLKMYAGRMHSRRMQDLPYDVATILTPDEAAHVDSYCGNDLDVTEDLRNGLRDRIALREAVSGRLGVDVRSKSDAQIAEAWIASALGYRPKKAIWPHGSTFRYTPPAYIQYRTEQLQNVLQVVRDTVFTVNDRDTRPYSADEEAGPDGVQLPATIDGRLVTMGATTYKMGIGGIHSQESKLIARSDEDATIENSDVGSYYPSLMLQLGLFPKSIGARFLEIFRDIYTQRLDAKALAKKLGKLMADVGLSPDEIKRLKKEFKEAKTLESGFKIVLNGCYGKLGSKYSFLFAPDLMIAVTLTGQLALLMLAERFELAGISVISANTDGIVCRVPRALKPTHTAIIKQWESDTGLTMDTDQWAWLYARDVNNYVAMDADGKLKVKGAYGLSGLVGSDMVSISGKHPSTDICVKAVHAYLAKGVPVEESVRANRDIRDFVAIQKVTGGAEWGRSSMLRDKAKKAERVATLQLLGWTDISGKGDWVAPGGSDTGALPNEKAYKEACRATSMPGESIGKAIRWFYSVNGKPITNYKGGKVAATDGSRPIMELPDVMPNDVDYQWYITEAKSMILDLGVTM
jgi:hypothetical protein